MRKVRQALKFTEVSSMVSKRIKIVILSRLGSTGLCMTDSESYLLPIRHPTLAAVKLWTLLNILFIAPTCLRYLPCGPEADVVAETCPN